MLNSIALVAFLFLYSVSAKLCFPFAADTFCVYASDLGSSVKFRYDAPDTTGWVAFGPGESMSVGDIVVAWPNKDKTVTLSRRQVSGFQMPVYSATNKITVVQNETGVLTVDGKQRMIATFTREKAQLTGVAAQYAISKAAASFIWAGHPTANPGSTDPAASITKHAASTKRTVPATNLLDPSNAFGSSQSSGNGTVSNVASTTSPLLVAHGILLVLAWGVFAPAAIVVARFFKNKLGIWWFRVHYGLFYTAVAMTIAGFICIFMEVGGKGAAHFSTGYLKIGAHSIVGLIFVILVPIQAILGIVIDKMFNPHRTSIPITDKIHWWLGRSLWAIGALLLIPLGISLFGENVDEGLGRILLIVYFVYIVLVCGAFVGLQLKIGQVHHEEKSPVAYSSLATSGKDNFP